MAERRMFAKTIIDSDAFLDMPMSAQCLYFHLAMRADDDGFVNNPKKIQRMVGASDDDAKILLAKHFLIAFESGVVVIKHWRIHNYIQTDRYKPTVYAEEKARLQRKDNGAYTLVSNMDTPCIQDVSNSYTQDRIGKDSKELGKSKRFVPPTLEEVRAYCIERKNGIDPQRFLDYYEARGWELKQGQKVKDWKACVRTWERSGYNTPKTEQKRSSVTKKDIARMERYLGRMKGETHEADN